MCGIFGVVGNFNAMHAAVCLAQLAHRGPDGEGVWTGEGVVLGHRRLSILDLSDAARQPMADASGRFQITFNGEIYNFLELKRELQALGHAFRTDSDTEVILAAFAQWREQCLLRMNGMWAFAIWDARERALFLARDRLGKKPLFYTEQPGIGFAFGSEMKALLPLMRQVVPDRALFRDHSRIFTYESTPQCLIEGIRRFPAGSFGWVRAGGLSVTRWWNTLDHLVEVPSRYEDQVALVRETFLDACRLRMRSDVPIGTCLSGGLDSSATISAVAHIAGSHGLERTAAGWQHAFVASFPGTPYDEVPFARRVCEHVRVSPTIVEIDPVIEISKLMRYFYLFEDIYITSPVPFMQTYASVKQNSVSVTLDGHGADELFGGYCYDHLVAMRDAGVNLRASLQVVDTYIDSLPVSNDGQIVSPRSRTLFWAKWQAKDLVKRLLNYHVDLPSRDSEHPAWKELDSTTRRLYVATHETTLPTLLRNYDRYSMASGVEVRMPFLDHRLLSLAFSLPWNSKIRGGYSKAIIRDAFAPYLPSEIVRRKIKIGFNAPMTDWMRGSLKTFMLDSISSRAFRDCDLIDASAVAAQVRNVIEGAAPTFDEAHDAWTSFSPFLWEQAMLGNVFVRRSSVAAGHDSNVVLAS